MFNVQLQLWHARAEGLRARKVRVTSKLFLEHHPSFVGSGEISSPSPFFIRPNETGETTSGAVGQCLGLERNLGELNYHL